MSEHETELLGAYVLDVLDKTEKTTVQEHLAGCADCRREVDELREMEAALGEIPPEAFIEGPPEDGDLLLQRTLREVRGRRTGGGRQRRALWALAAAVVAVALAGGGIAVGRSSAPVAPIAVATTVPGSRTATATDAGTGATMAVVLKPAAGWVRVSASVSGVAAGQQCRLVVVAKDGTRREAGSWLVSETGAKAGTTLDGSALVPLTDVSSVQVETLAGQSLVNVPV